TLVKPLYGRTASVTLLASFRTVLPGAVVVPNGNWFRSITYCRWRPTLPTYDVSSESVFVSCFWMPKLQLYTVGVFRFGLNAVIATGKRVPLASTPALSASTFPENTLGE